MRFMRISGVGCAATLSATICSLGLALASSGRDVVVISGGATNKQGDDPSKRIWEGTCGSCGHKQVQDETMKDYWPTTCYEHNFGRQCGGTISWRFKEEL